MDYLTLAMVWILSGLFVAYLMRLVDEKKDSKTKWIKNPSFCGSFFGVIILVIGGPITLLLGIVVMADYIDINN